MSDQILLSARAVSKTYHQRHTPPVHAAIDVSVDAFPGRTVGLIGQSGSGKTTVTRLMLGIEKPTSGAIEFKGDDLHSLEPDGMRDFRRTVAAVFQNPYASLNPRMRIWASITEQLAIDRTPKAQRKDKAVELLDQVGFPAEVGERYPHQLSGGQRQRIAIARALAAEPKVIVLDEPLSALDVSVQAQIVNLLLDLQTSLGLAYIFVGHDLAVARQLCDELLVMSNGRVVERGEAGQVLNAPADPYTVALVNASALDESSLERGGPRTGASTADTADERPSDELPAYP